MHWISIQNSLLLSVNRCAVLYTFEAQNRFSLTHFLFSHLSFSFYVNENLSSHFFLSRPQGLFFSLNCILPPLSTIFSSLFFSLSSFPFFPLSWVLDVINKQNGVILTTKNKSKEIWRSGETERSVPFPFSIFVEHRRVGKRTPLNRESHLRLCSEFLKCLPFYFEADWSRPRRMFFRAFTSSYVHERGGGG